MKQLIVSLIFLSSIVNASTNEGLLSKFDAYSSALLDSLEKDTTSTISALNGVRTTKNYNKCIDPGFFTSKKEQMIACLKASDEMGKATKINSSTNYQKDLLVRRTETDLNTTIGELEGSLYELATNTKSTLTIAYNKEVSVIDSWVNGELETMNTSCSLRDLGESVECALNATIDNLSELPPKMRLAKVSLEQVISGLRSTLMRGFDEQ